jgi:hypothetical protein
MEDVVMSVHLEMTDLLETIGRETEDEMTEMIAGMTETDLTTTSVAEVEEHAVVAEVQSANVAIGSESVSLWKDHTTATEMCTVDEFDWS